MLISQVDAVDPHLQHELQRCLNLTVMPFGKPRGGIFSAPVTNLNRFDNYITIIITN